MITVGHLLAGLEWTVLANYGANHQGNGSVVLWSLWAASRMSAFGCTADIDRQPA